MVTTELSVLGPDLTFSFVASTVAAPYARLAAEAVMVNAETRTDTIIMAQSKLFAIFICGAFLSNDQPTAGIHYDRGGYPVAARRRKNFTSLA
jgi:hypothetical protein